MQVRNTTDLTDTDYSLENKKRSDRIRYIKKPTFGYSLSFKQTRKWQPCGTYRSVQSAAALRACEQLSIVFLCPRQPSEGHIERDKMLFLYP